MVSNDFFRRNEKDFSHALTVFTIATTVTCLFAPVFEIGVKHSLVTESRHLALEKEKLVERKNKLLSTVEEMQTPENIYNMAVEQDYRLNLINPVN